MAPMPGRSALVIDASPRWRAQVGEWLRAHGWHVLAYAAPPEDGPATVCQLIVLEVPAAGHPGAAALLQRLAGPGTRCVLVTRQAPGDLPPELAQHPRVAGVLHRAAFDETALLALASAGLSPAPVASPVDGPRVLVVEDDLNWRSIYDELLAEAGCMPDFAVSYGEARSWLQRVDYALAIVDLNLASSAAPEGNRDGLHLLRVTRQQGLPSIVVSALGDPADIDRAYDEHGIFAFIEKEGFERRSFLRILAEAFAATRPERVASPASGLEDLTPREREVLSLLAQGLTNRQIAEALLITPNTTKKHVDHILQKLGVSTRAGAVAAVLRAGQPAHGRRPGPGETEARP
jgi:DNA-binding NarL/FixJ family response regulator